MFWALRQFYKGEQCSIILFASLEEGLPKRGYSLQRKKNSPKGANFYFEEMTPSEKGGKNIYAKATSQETMFILFKADLSHIDSTNYVSG